MTEWGVVFFQIFFHLQSPLSSLEGNSVNLHCYSSDFQLGDPI